MNQLNHLSLLPWHLAVIIHVALQLLKLNQTHQRDFTGKMGFNEFKELFTALNGWKQNFLMFDQDRSGTVEPHEMTQAINAMGESLNSLT